MALGKAVVSGGTMPLASSAAPACMNVSNSCATRAPGLLSRRRAGGERGSRGRVDKAGISGRARTCRSSVKMIGETVTVSPRVIFMRFDAK